MPPVKRKVNGKVVKKPESSDESSEYDSDNEDSRTSVQDKQPMNKRKRVAYNQMDSSSDSSSNESDSSNEYGSFLSVADDDDDDEDYVAQKATIKNKSNKKATIKPKAANPNNKLYRNARKPPAAKFPKRAPVNRKTESSDTSVVSDESSIESIQPAPKRATRGRPKKDAKKPMTAAKKRAPAKRAATRRQPKKEPSSTWSIPSQEASDVSIVEKPKPRKQPRKQPLKKPPKPPAKQRSEPKTIQAKDNKTITNPITSNPKAITTEPPKDKIVERKNAQPENKPRFRFYPFGQPARNAPTLTIDSVSTASLDIEEESDMEDMYIEDMDMEETMLETAELGQTDESKPEVEEPEVPEEPETPDEIKDKDFGKKD